MATETTDDDLREQYDFDYSQAKPNRFASRAKQPPVASTAMRDKLQKLQEAATNFARARELAEAQVPQADAVILQLRKSNMLSADYVLVGEVVHIVAEPESDDSRYFAVGIQGDQGVGAHAFLLRSDEQLNESTYREFVPFAKCPPMVQARLADHLDGLLAQLMRELGVPA